MEKIINWQLVQDDKRRSVSSPEDQPVIAFIQAEEDFRINAVCGGAGTCRKCRLRVTSENPPKPTPEERESLSSEELDLGYRLACFLKPVQGMLVSLDESEGMSIQTDFGALKRNEEARYTVRNLNIPEASLEDPKSLGARILEQLEISDASLPASILNLLYSDDGAEPEEAGALSAVMRDGELAALCLPEDIKKIRLAAVDVGTTTIAVYLLDLDGGIVGKGAIINPQTRYGADVISRIKFASEAKVNTGELGQSVSAAISEVLEDLIRQDDNNDPRNVLDLTVAGNTAMMHFLFRLDSRGLGHAPFIPAALSFSSCAASVIGIKGFPLMRVTPLPSISSYVGADLSAGIISTAMSASGKTELLVDIGTNGEIVLSMGGEIYCTSTAAGPAFEGAGLSCGCGSIPGAVDHIELKQGQTYISTIGNKPASGICGSGVIDFLAVLLELGLMDETGRLEDDAETSNPDFCLVEIEDQISVRLSAESGGEIYITQKDIREIQLAKAAILAGILTLMEIAQVEMKDIETLHLAGGFGTHMSPEAAVRIGLLPDIPIERIKSPGNTSALGAIECVINRNSLDEIKAKLKTAKSIELSGREDFQRNYMNAMYFQNE